MCKHILGAHEQLVFHKATCNGWGGRKLLLATAALLEKSACLSSQGNSSLPTRDHDQPNTSGLGQALGNVLQEEKAAQQLCTHLADLPAGETVKPFQAQRENLGCTMDCEPLGGSNVLVTPANQAQSPVLKCTQSSPKVARQPLLSHTAFLILIHCRILKKLHLICVQ